MTLLGQVLSSAKYPVQEILFDDLLVDEDAASFDFIEIPQTYKHLILFGAVKSAISASSEAWKLRFNNISTSTYDWVEAVFGNNAASFLEGAAETSANPLHIVGSTAPEGIFSMVYGYFPNYADTDVAPSYVFLNYTKIANVATSQWIYFGGGSERSAAAIDRITLYAAANDMLAGSRMTLYGVN